MATVRKRVEQRAIDKAIAAGADPKTTTVVESEAIPIACKRHLNPINQNEHPGESESENENEFADRVLDTSGRCRFYVKAAGDWTGAATQPEPSPPDLSQLLPEGTYDPSTPITPLKPVNQHLTLPQGDVEWTAQTMSGYTPKVESGTWFLSEIDVEWLATGCYILGCGGGGNPQHVFLALRNIIREGHSVRVVDLKDMSNKGLCLWGGGIGSPEVSMERLIGEEYNQACRELIEFMRVSPRPMFHTVPHPVFLLDCAEKDAAVQ